MRSWTSAEARRTWVSAWRSSGRTARSTVNPRASSRAPTRAPDVSSRTPTLTPSLAVMTRARLVGGMPAMIPAASVALPRGANGADRLRTRAERDLLSDARGRLAQRRRPGAAAPGAAQGLIVARDRAALGACALTVVPLRHPGRWRRSDIARTTEDRDQRHPGDGRDHRGRGRASRRRVV